MTDEFQNLLSTYVNARSTADRMRAFRALEDYENTLRNTVTILARRCFNNTRDAELERASQYADLYGKARGHD